MAVPRRSWATSRSSRSPAACMRRTVGAVKERTCAISSELNARISLIGVWSWRAAEPVTWRRTASMPPARSSPHPDDAAPRHGPCLHLEGAAIRERQPVRHGAGGGQATAHGVLHLRGVRDSKAGDQTIERVIADQPARRHAAATGCGSGRGRPQRLHPRLRRDLQRRCLRGGGGHRLREPPHLAVPLGRHGRGAAGGDGLGRHRHAAQPAGPALGRSHTRPAAPTLSRSRTAAMIGGGRSRRCLLRPEEGRARDQRGPGRGLAGDLDGAVAQGPAARRRSPPDGRTSPDRRRPTRRSSRRSARSRRRRGDHAGGGSDGPQRRPGTRDGGAVVTAADARRRSAREGRRCDSARRSRRGRGRWTRRGPASAPSPRRQ